VAAGASEKKWSPDGGTLLVSGIKYSVGHAVLYALTIPDLTAHTLDSTTVVASYYYSWSPDACWVAYTRPTAVHPIAGDTIAADVWIASPATGEQWRLLETPEWIDSEPLWITNRSILIERTYWNGMNFGIVEHKVLDLDFAQQSRASP
jgi:Tol biopolymer transport system component